MSHPTYTQLAQITNPLLGKLGGNESGAGYAPSETAVTAAQTGVSFVAQFVRLWANIITFATIFVIIYFLWGALEWIVSGGDSGKLEKARQRILHAAIGLLILASSYVIIGFISGNLFEGTPFDILTLRFLSPDS